MKYQGVIFDLDGTLLDTIHDLADSMNKVLSDFGFPTHETKAYNYFVGDGMDQLVNRALPDGFSDQLIKDNVFSAMQREYEKRMFNKTRPYEGILELLAELQKIVLKKAVLSNKPHEFTKVVVDMLLPANIFELVWGVSPEIPKKPDPTGALAIAQRMAILPENILYLGDTATDMQTAKSAGMHPVGALWGFREAGELLANGAAEIISKPQELLKILKMY